MVGCSLGVLLLCSCAGTDTSTPSGGAVTAAKYRTAVEVTAECVVAKGFEVSKIDEAPDGVLLSFGIGGASDAEIESAGRAYDECYEEHLFEIEKTWWWQHVPTGAEREAMMDDLYQCMDAAGLKGLRRAGTATDLLAQITGADQPGGGGESTPETLERVGLAQICLDQYPFVYPDGMFGVTEAP